MLIFFGKILHEQQQREEKLCQTIPTPSSTSPSQIPL
jgi:hypothetical protein